MATLRELNRFEGSRATTSRPAVFVSIPGTPGGGVAISTAHKTSQEPGISYKTFLDRIGTEESIALSDAENWLDFLGYQASILHKVYSRFQAYVIQALTTTEETIKDTNKAVSVFVSSHTYSLLRNTHLSINSRLWKAANTIASPGERDISRFHRKEPHDSLCPWGWLCAVEGAGGI